MTILNANIIPDLDAHLYRNHSKLQLNLSEKVLEDFETPPDSKVLDVGCGDGRITATLFERISNGKVIGIDPSEDMIRLSSESFSRSKYPGLEFYPLSAEEFCLQNITLDAIVSFSCLHWLRKPKETIPSLLEKLKKNGKVVFLTYPKESLFYSFLNKAAEKYPEFRKKSAFETMLTTNEYKEVIEKKINITTFETHELIASFSSEEDLKQFIKGWLVNYIPLPLNLQEEYLDSVLKISRTYNISMNNGLINLPYTALVVKGFKS